MELELTMTTMTVYNRNYNKSMQWIITGSTNKLQLCETKVPTVANDVIVIRKERDGSIPIPWL